MRSILEGDADTWVDLVTKTASLEDVKAYLDYLATMRDWTCSVANIDANDDDAAAASVSSFQSEFNARTSSSILVDGVCGKKTLGAIFAILELELQEFAGKHGISGDELDAIAIEVLDASNLAPEFASSANLGDSPCVDFLVIESRMTDGGELTPQMLYARFVAVGVFSPFSSNFNQSSVELQLLSPDGFPYVDVLVTVPGSGEAASDANGIARVFDAPEGEANLELPAELFLPHPRNQKPIAGFSPVDSDLKISHAPTTAIPVVVNRRQRAVVESPTACDAVIGCHFDPESAFPAENILLLVQAAHEAVNVDPERRMVLFGHAAVGAGDAKSLADRRARVAHAMLVGDLDELVAVTGEDGWEDAHFRAVLGFLGVAPRFEDATGTDRVREFQYRYNDAEYLDEFRERGHEQTIEIGGEFDAPTKRAALDAYIAELASNLTPEQFADTPVAGCAEFNLFGDSASQHNRVTLAVFGANELPSRFPCEKGNAEACEREQAFDGRCRFYRQRIGERTNDFRVLSTDDDLGSDDVMLGGGRLLEGPGHAAALLAHGALAIGTGILDDVAYRFSATSAVLDTSGGPEGAPAVGADRITPRFHWVKKAGQTVAGGGNASIRLDKDLPPDGVSLVPMNWTKGDPRTLGEIYSDFLVRAFGKLNAVAFSDAAAVASLLEQFDMLKTPQNVQDALKRATSENSFDDVHRRVLKAGLIAAGQALNPDVSTRYKHRPGVYKCNIYATDFIDLLPHGAYLPKATWSFPLSVRKKPDTASDAPTSATSVTGVNRFIRGSIRGYGGADFGWSVISGRSRFDIRTEAQRRANEGQLVVFSAGNKGRHTIGHMGLVVPEKTSFAGKNPITPWGDAVRRDDKRVRRVWKSQAGAINGHGMTAGTLILDPSHDYTSPGYYRYDPATDQSRGQPEFERVHVRRARSKSP